MEYEFRLSPPTRPCEEGELHTQPECCYLMQTAAAGCKAVQAVAQKTGDSSNRGELQAASERRHPFIRPCWAVVYRRGQQLRVRG